MSFFLSISFLLFIAVSTYARAGGGGGGVGGGRGGGRPLIVLLGIVYLMLMAVVVYWKSKKAKQLIAQSASQDGFWSYDKMIELTRDAFVRMQNAWMERNMELVKDIVTEQLYKDFQRKLDWQKVKHEQNIVEDIKIKRTKIIGIEDHDGKDNDKFAVYIKGSLVDYTISDKTAKVYTNKSKDTTEFVDLYYFVRRNDKWLLDRIDNDVSLGKILKVKEIVH